MAGIDIGKTSREMIRNGTWTFKDGTFYQALRLESGKAGIVAYDGDFHFPEDWSRAERKEAREKISFVLGLNMDLDSFYAQISDSPFEFLVDEFYGLSAPASPSPYQALVEVIAQQQVNFDFAQRTIGNLVKLAGEPVRELYLFPTAEKINELGEEKLREARLGYRAGYIKSLTELYLEGKLNLELWDWGIDRAIRYLTRFRGVGKWTAELFLAYGLRKNVYPAGDLGLRRGIAKIFGKRLKEVKEKDVREIIEPYGEWKGLLAFYILCYDRKTEMERRKR
ncbi:DNA-3-methyladenine glycosylase [Thermococcus sp.]|uniref:DNA-3-methyladenine glycosylase family protein n=1 Tax=Thermococcus sp. TaxID=35749 RepID=UPI0025D92685|nr:DNA-3-methyladenine glycosylase [Thermococcus sp.]